MSVGPLGGIASSAAGSPLAQTKGSDIERAEQDASNQQRRVRNEQKADSAAGIGETDGEDHEPADRDADGRRLWEMPPAGEETAADDENGVIDGPRKGVDPTGDSGTQLDLTG